MVSISTSAAVATAVAAFIIFVARFNANRQHVRKLQTAKAVSLDLASSREHIPMRHTPADLSREANASVPPRIWAPCRAEGIHPSPPTELNDTRCSGIHGETILRWSLLPQFVALQPYHHGCCRPISSITGRDCVS